MEDLIVSWGPTVATLTFAGLAAAMTWLVFSRMAAGKVRDLLQRAWTEIIDAAREVFQTYVESLKASKDPLSEGGGSLTAAEKAEAKSRAIAIFKQNFGKKGLVRLGKIIGVDLENWIGSKVESAVNILKVEGSAAGKGTAAVPSPLP